MPNFADLAKQFNEQMDAAKRGGGKSKEEREREKAQRKAAREYTFFKPLAGDNQIRLLPLPGDPDAMPFILVSEQNEKLGLPFPVLSLTTFGEADPIFETMERLKSSRDRKEWETGCKLETSDHYLGFVLIRGRESEGIKLWRVSPKLVAEFLTKAGRIKGDILSLTDGYDIYVTGNKDFYKGAPCVKTGVVDIARETSPVTEDPAVWENIKDAYPSWTDFYIRKEYDDLKKELDKALEKMLGTGEDVPQEQSQTASGAAAPEAQKPRYTAPASKPASAAQAKPAAAAKNSKPSFNSAFEDEGEDLPF